MEKCILKNIVMENTNTIKCLLININNIDNISWKEPEYIKKICDLNIYNFIDLNSDNIISVIGKNFNYEFLNNIIIDKEIIYEESEYIYELLYINMDSFTEYMTDEYLNGVGSLLNTNGNKIYFNSIILKTYLPLNTESIILENMEIKDIEKILFNRANKQIILYNDDYKEEILFGDIETYGNIFFNNEYYLKKEIKFLSYNLNIWYTNSEYGEENICGKLISNLIDKCVIFIKIDENNLGNITLDEFKKIIYLSNKLDNYSTPTEYLNTKLDKYNRKIINNKCKILHLLYNKYL